MEDTSQPSADNRPPPERSGAEEVRRRARQSWTFLRPRLWQTAVNLRVWVPAFSNRGVEVRRVRLWAREFRHGLTWQFDLPQQCWKCGQTDELVSRRIERRVRSFDMPLVNAAGMGGVTLALLLWASWFDSYVVSILALASIPVGFAVVMFRSWVEEVELRIWSCREHEEELQPPEMVVDQGELFLFTATAELAKAANRELASRRRRDVARHGSPQAASDRPTSATGDESESADKPPEPGTLFGNRPPKPDLPPIKLVGDEEEDESGTGKRES